MDQQSTSRIPLALQAIFLTSNRGKDVNTPPPQKVAFKTFFRGWLGSSESKNVKNAKKLALTTESSKQAGKSTITPKKKKKVRNLQHYTTDLPLWLREITNRG